MKHYFPLLILICAFLSINVKAATLTDEEYAKLNQIFSEARINAMTDEEAKVYLSYNFGDIINENKYYKTTKTTNGYITTEVTEAEVMAAKGARAVSYKTNYKNLRITATNIGGNSYLVNLYLSWLVNPKVRSYDVIGMRTSSSYVSEGSQDGTQVYYSPSLGKYNYVSYGYKGTNMVIQDNGYGISMNLVDEGSSFECDTTAIIIASNSAAKVSGSYQHATAGVTLAESQNYKISANGYGQVFNFYNTNARASYDGMSGVAITLPYSS